MSDEERRFTLDEARAEIARRECGWHGHDWSVLCEGLAQTPVTVLCERCGISYAVSRA